MVQSAGEKESVTLQSAAKSPPTAVLFRRDQTYVVWDSRGLTIRVGKKVFSTRMPEIAVTPKLFSHEEILANLKQFKVKHQRKEANALSGSRRFGNKVFLVPRWDDAKGKPWLEALVSVDLTDPNPKPKLLGRFDGLTLSRKPIDDQLFIQEGKLSAITQGADTWGLATYDPSISAYDYMSLGDTLKQFVPMNWPMGRFVEDTAYGTTVAGQVNLRDADRQNLAEGRGAMRFLDADDPAIVSLVGVDGPALRNVATGAEMTLPSSYGSRRTKTGIVVWSPLKDPESATLYDPNDWSVLATWKR